MANLKAKKEYLKTIERLKKELSKEILETYIKSHSYKETLIYFSQQYKCSQKCIREMLNYFEVHGRPIGYILTKENEEIKKQAMIDKYGEDNPQKVKSIHEKTKQTNLAKYGVENSFQNKEVQEKQKQTCLDKYGVENVFAAESIKEKIKQTMLKQYGVSHVMQAQEIIDKTKQTKLNKYGDSGYHNTDKMCQTKLQKYGTTGYNNFEKAKQTNLNRYGVENIMQSDEIYKKTWKKYHFDGLNFDSSWEIAFYLYYKDQNIQIEREPIRYTYIFNNTQHKYAVDFKVNNEFYEIKSIYLLKKMQQPETIDNAKYICMQEHNINIIDDTKIKPYLQYVIDTYGKDFLKQLKKTKVSNNI